MRNVDFETNANTARNTYAPYHIRASQHCPEERTPGDVVLCSIHCIPAVHKKKTMPVRISTIVHSKTAIWTAFHCLPTGGGVT